MSIASSSTWRCLSGYLLISFVSSVVSAQVSVSWLVPNTESLRPRVQPGTLAQETLTPIALHIEVLKGDRGINIIKKRTAVAPVVEVRDRNNVPVAGAAVTFTSPNDGASVVFMNGSRSVTVVTEANGRATTPALKPVNPGGFQISVSATFQSQIATATISMTNVMTVAAAAGVAAGVGGTVATGASAAGLSAGMIATIVGVAAAAAIGVGVGVANRGSSTAATVTTATIGVGTGATFGAPHWVRRAR